MPQFSKVLILTNCAINDVDAHGALLGNYFHDWPKDHLGHIYQDALTQSDQFCGYEYCFQREDRHFGALYSRLKGSPVGVAARRQKVQTEKKGLLKSRLQRAAYSLSRMLIASGLWELIFRPRISPAMEAWVKALDPEVIYVQGYSLFYVWLALKLRGRFSTRICMHVLDDWPRTIYTDSAIGFLMRPLVRHYFLKLARASEVRLCIGDAMRDEFKRRYNLEFISILNCDDVTRYSEAGPTRTAPSGTTSIVYSGSIGVGRWQSLIDVCGAARALSGNGKPIQITAYTPDVPPEVRGKLSKFDDVLMLRDSLKNVDVPGALKGADILLLIESFDERHRDVVRLSIATKAHLYMMAQRPILVYGPDDVGVVRYAMSEGWADVVTSQSALEEELSRLVSNPSGNSKTIATALAVALRNHSAPRVRERFRSLLIQNPALLPLKTPPKVVDSLKQA